jgi:hypothetical protein
MGVRSKNADRSAARCYKFTAQNFEIGSFAWNELFRFTLSDEIF